MRKKGTEMLYQTKKKVLLIIIIMALARRKISPPETSVEIFVLGFL